MSVRLPLAFLLGVAAAAVVACGSSSSKLLPPAGAARLTDQLAQVKQAVDEQDCAKAATRVQILYADLARLPPTVDRRLRSRLREGIDKLSARVPTDCNQPQTQTQTLSTETTTTPPATTQTQTTPPTDTQTPTTSTPTTTTPPTSTPTTPSNGGTQPPGNGGATTP